MDQGTFAMQVDALLTGVKALQAENEQLRATIDQANTDRDAILNDASGKVQAVLVDLGISFPPVVEGDTAEAQ